MSDSLYTHVTVLGQKCVRPNARATYLYKVSRCDLYSTPYYNINMRSFGAEISGNRMPGGELSDAQRVFALAQLEASVTTKEIAATLGC